MDSHRTPDFVSFIAGIAQALRQRQLPFMLIGGQAVLLHGRPRLTEDIDITLGVDPTRLDSVLEVCESLGLTPLPEDVVGFVRDTFVLPAADEDSGVRVDFIFSTTPYERQAIGRAEEQNLEGVPVPFATAEDLILHKLFAGRATDWEDAVSVVRRKGSELDRAYLERWTNEFATVPGREDLPDRLGRLMEEANAAD